jgi:hypothetical protein
MSLGAKAVAYAVPAPGPLPGAVNEDEGAWSVHGLMVTAAVSGVITAIRDV